MSAIEDGLKEFRPFDLELPITSLKVWNIIQQGLKRQKEARA